MDLKNLFYPKSIAVIGASKDPAKLGNVILKNIISCGYKGKAYPVNLQEKKILGLKCYKNVLDIDPKIDLAVIVIPSKFVPKVIEECGRKEIKNVIVISAGFGEIGEKGLELSKEVEKIADKYSINILGPNCLGILNSDNGLNCSFAQDMINKGNIAFVSQSGAICTAMLDWAKNKNLGFSKFVSLGNKLEINENDLLEYLDKDKQTQIILFYLEDIKQGEKFVRLANKIIKNKPIVLLKAGKSSEAQKAISSHTGSLASSDKLIEAAAKKSGITRVSSLEELFLLSLCLAGQPLPLANKIVIITNAGGPGVITTDHVSQSGLSLSKFQNKTVDLLKKELPAEANTKNPIDLVGDALEDRYKKALEICLKDKNVDSLIILLTPQKITPVEKIAQLLVNFNKKSKKPLISVFMGGKRVSRAKKNLNKNLVPDFNYPEQAVDVLEKMWQIGKGQKVVIPRAEYKTSPKAEEIIKEAKDNNYKFLPFKKAEDILKLYGFKVARSGLVKNKRQAVKIASELGYPVVLKIASQKIVHKSDAGGVEVNLKNSQEVKEAYDKILKKTKVKSWRDDEGILVQPMSKAGQEIILGMKRDENFGPLIMVGLGGIFVEVLGDVSWRLAPLNKKLAKEMLKELKAFSLLAGVRGRKKFDIESLAQTIVLLSNLSLAHPEIKELDINPLFLFKKSYKIVDLRFKIA